MLAFLLVGIYYNPLSLKGPKRGIGIIIELIIYSLRTDLRLWIMRGRNLANILTKLHFLRSVLCLQRKKRREERKRRKQEKRKEKRRANLFY